jgi:hypothetical protein
MKNRYLDGEPVSAYFYLPRRPGDVGAKKVSGSGLVTDYTPDDRPIGIKITSPSALTLDSLNTALKAAGQPHATPNDVAPLLAYQRRTLTAE